MSIEEIKRAISRAQELKYHTVNKALDIMLEEFPNLAALGLLNDVISIVERRLKDLRSACKDDPKMFLNI